MSQDADTQQPEVAEAAEQSDVSEAAQQDGVFEVAEPGREESAPAPDAGAAGAASGVPVGVYVEVERKLEAPKRWSIPSLVGVGRVERVSDPRRMRQTATYLDTPWLDLLKAKHTLRRRTGGSDAGWHLKKPGEGDARVELAAPLGRGIARVPPELRDEVTRVIGPMMLGPVCLLRTRRTRRQLHGAGGDDASVLALIEDDTVEAHVLLGGERIKRWRELEVELVDGGPADLEAIVAVLVESGCTVSDAPSKLNRALEDEQVERGGTSAGEKVLEYVAAQAGVLQAFEPRVRADAPDAVHKARVATRRLRSTLRTYRRLFDRSLTDPLRAELKWAAGVLGEPRDAEVMRDRLLSAVDELAPDLVRGPIVDRMRATLEERHAAAHSRMVKGLDSPRYEQLLEALVDVVLDPPWSQEADRKAERVLPRLVGKAADAVTKEADAAVKVPEPVERQEAIHGVRKLAKRARYAAEAAGDLSGKRAPAIVAAWTDVQDALGEHQDSVVARDVIELIYRDALQAGEDTFTYGVLIADEHHEAQTIEEGMDTLLAKARKATKDVD